MRLLRELQLWDVLSLSLDQGSRGLPRITPSQLGFPALPKPASDRAGSLLAQQLPVLVLQFTASALQGVKEKVCPSLRAPRLVKKKKNKTQTPRPNLLPARRDAGETLSCQP